MSNIWIWFGAAILVAATTIVAPASEVPLPKAKPAVSVPDSGPSGSVPLPRPKPDNSAAQSKDPPAPPPSRPLSTSRRGQLEVKFNELGRERDPDKASNLTATTKTEWSSKQIAAARKQCAFLLAATNLDAEQIDPVGGPEGCGIAAPIKVAAFGAVAVNPAAKLNCKMAAAVYKWLVETVQPQARKTFKQPVVEIRNLSSYQCRTRRGVAGGRISEHSFGNALDIGSFKLAGGQKLSVLDDWSSTLSFFGFDASAGFLTKTHEGACKLFATVLGPKANKAHANHFHFDLGRDGRYRICK